MLKKFIGKLANRLGYGIVSRQTLRDLEVNASIPMHYVAVARLMYLRRLLELTAGVEGDVVECGVGHGRSFLTLAQLLRTTGSKKNLWGFDSFEGFPEPSAADDPETHGIHKGHYAVNMAAIQKVLYTFLNDDVFLRARVTMIKGFFEESLPATAPKLGRISLLNLDVDIYDSYRTCLEVLHPLVSSGGIVTFDEYLREGTRFPGARKAIDEFYKDKPDEFRKDEYYGKYYAIKP